MPQPKNFRNLTYRQLEDNQSANHLCFSCAHVEVCKMAEAIGDVASPDDRFTLTLSQCAQYDEDVSTDGTN